MVDMYKSSSILLSTLATKKMIFGYTFVYLQRRHLTSIDSQNHQGLQDQHVCVEIGLQRRGLPVNGAIYRDCSLKCLSLTIYKSFFLQRHAHKGTPL